MSTAQGAASIVGVIKMLGSTIGRTPPEGYRYTSLYDYVARNGLVYESQALTEAEERWFRAAAGRTRFPIKECFSNSQNFLLLASMHAPPEGWHLRYVEGFVICHDGVPMPIHHGWVTLNGKVLDLTLRRGPQKRGDRFSDRTVGTFDQREYMGVPFTWEQVRRFIVRTKTMGTLIDNYGEGHPLLRGEAP